MKQPSLLRLYGAAIVPATALTVAFLWLFDIQVSGFHRYSEFPDGWTVFEFIRNAFAVMLWIGSVKAIATGLREYWTERPALDGPPDRDHGDVG